MTQATTAAAAHREKSGLDLSLPRSALLANAAMIVADLDQTLVKTSQAHRELVTAYMHSIAPGIGAEEVQARYDELRGQAYGNILQGMRSLCAHRESFSLTAAQFVAGFHPYVASWSPAKGPVVEVIPGARELLEEIRDLKAHLVVCTGSPRSLAQLFLRQAGLEQFVAADKLFCWGDTQYAKSDPEFWRPILRSEDRNRVIAIDDHPHSVEYVLGAGGIGGVIALPSVEEHRFAPLMQTYPQRIKLVRDTWNSWH